MIAALISWLALVIIVALLYWILSQFAPAPIMRIVLAACVVIIVLALVWLLIPLAHLTVR
jgi:hypothetical protein